MTWAQAVVTEIRPETPNARTLVLEVDGWPGHIAGQHVDVRLTAEDGYTAVRSYSIASSAASTVLEITVDRLDDGEVSPYLVDVAEVGDLLEIRGPAGGWFIWRRETPGPVQLIGGGSGIVPLMAMIRTHGDTGSAAPFRLLYSTRSPELTLFRDELIRREADDAALAVDWAFTRQAPPDAARPAGRLDAEGILAAVAPPSAGAAVFVCGSTPFVEAIADVLVAGGYPPEIVKTERYGGIASPPVQRSEAREAG